MICGGTFSTCRSVARRETPALPSFGTLETCRHKEWTMNQPPIIGVVGRLARADDALDARRAYTALAACTGLLLCGYVMVLVALDASFRLTLRSML